MADKVKFGIKNAHVFPILSVNQGIPLYDDPIAIPGAVSFSLDAQGDVRIYADNIIFIVCI